MSYQETLFNEREEGREEGEIKGTIQTYFKFGKSIDETVLGIINEFPLTNEVAEEYVRKYRPAAH